MIRNNKGKTVISSVVILIPALTGLILWDRLPDSMAVHFGSGGSADGFAGKYFAVFGLPLILLAVHILGLWLTSRDKNQEGQNRKALGIIFWIVPCLSLICSGIIYAAALGREPDVMFFVPVILGVLFIILGNYLPKIRQNRTLGIKIYWTLNNEENWNLTHRFAGKVWVAAGIIMLLSALLPVNRMLAVSAAALFIAVILPVIYSWRIYKRHREAGTGYKKGPRSRNEKTALGVTGVLTAVILIAVSVLMFTGNIGVRYGEDSFKIEADYYQDLEIRYADIDRMQYREDLKAGSRTYGFGSPRLSMGTYRNDELGSYTRYSYTRCGDCVVMEIGGKILVLNGKDRESTKEIYESLSEKMNGSR